MKRIVLCAALLIVAPALAVAQTAPPPPPPAPAAPLPMPAPAAPAVPAPPAVPAVAPVAPLAPMVFMPATVDTYAISEAMRAAEAQVRAIDMQAVQNSIQLAADQMRMAAPAVPSFQVFQNDVQWQLADLQARGQGPFMAVGGSAEANNYNNGLNNETQRRYDQAITYFDKVIASKGTHADGALYHKAWCQAKLGKSDEAVTTLAELKRDYSQSLYLKDARALEVDVKKLGPSQVDDDDIKLLAIQGIQSQNPDAAIPALESVLNKPTNSEHLRERALYVLATNDQPRAHQILLSYAKGGGNPDLQRAAIGYLANRGQKTSSAELIDIYNGSSNLDVRLAVIRAFRSAGAKEPLMRIASGAGFGVANGRGVTYVTGADGSTNTVVATGRGGRGAAMAGPNGTGAGANPSNMNSEQLAQMAQQRLAINGLVDLASPQELWPLYQKEENADLRGEWISTFSAMGAIDQLMQIIKTEKDPTVRARAIRSLGNTRSDKAGPALVEMYGTGDREVKMAVISALGNENNAESLVAIARKETDPELRREIVSELANMAKNSPVAMNYLLELLKGPGLN